MKREMAEYYLSNQLNLNIKNHYEKQINSHPGHADLSCLRL